MVKSWKSVVFNYFSEQYSMSLHNTKFSSLILCLNQLSSDLLLLLVLPLLETSSEHNLHPDLAVYSHDRRRLFFSNLWQNSLTKYLRSPCVFYQRICLRFRWRSCQKNVEGTRIFTFSWHFIISERSSLSLDINKNSIKYKRNCFVRWSI